MSSTRRFGSFLLLVALLLVAGSSWPSRAQDLSDWATQPGYHLEIDSRGFDLPSAIAVVPSPGDGPDAPIYYVAELRGAIKVVTRDRSIHDFAQVPTYGKQSGAFDGQSQQGLAGLCLDPEHGYLFATFTDPDAGGVLRNRIQRFTTQPETFGFEPLDTQPIGEVLATVQSAPAHQIGGCQIDGGRLYVGVGDGGNASAAADLDRLLGKLLCFTLDGEPCPDNPFIDGGADGAPRDFVWAYGFRNPFGLTFVDHEPYVAQNGIDRDLFLKPRKGKDHLWRGTDQSLMPAADLVFTPTISPVALAYVPPDAPFMDENWSDRFVTAAFGGKGTSAGLVAFGSLQGDPRDHLPAYLLEWVGEGDQHLAGVALGDDALYVVPMLPVVDGEGVVMRLSYAPSEAHGRLVTPRSDLMAANSRGPIAEHGCTSCHNVDGQGGGIGPTLDKFGISWRLTNRLNSDAYREQVAAVDALDSEPFVSYRDAREQVLAAHGLERTWVWLEYFLQEPKFDRTDTLMPDLDLSAEEARAVRADLFDTLNLEAGNASGGLWDRGLVYLDRHRTSLLLGGVGGFVAALVLAGLLALMLRGRQDRHRP